MRTRSQLLASFIFMAAMAAPAMISGCAARVSTGYRVYDPGYGDYHQWDNNEIGFYGRWENDTHRKHEDFRHRPAAEQKEYWTWRHGQH